MVLIWYSNGHTLFCLFNFSQPGSTWLWQDKPLPIITMTSQSSIQAQIKENIKAPGHWPLCGGIHRGPVNSPQKGPVTQKMFPFDDVIMLNENIQTFVCGRTFIVYYPNLIVSFNLSGTETGIFEENKVNIIDDALAPCIMGSSAAKILKCKIRRYLSSTKKQFNYLHHFHLEK